MKYKSLNVPATVEIAPRKITKHKSHFQSSVFCLNQIKITHSTGNDQFLTLALDAWILSKFSTLYWICLLLVFLILVGVELPLCL